VLGPGTGSGRRAELANPRQELVALVRRLAAPGAGVGERNQPAANERLTAAAAAALFVLIFVEGLTLLRIGSLMTMHVIVGLILVPPVLIKLGSTGWRFLRYYTGHPDFVRKGPPARLLRVLAPFLVLTTVVLFASGIALVVVHRPYGWLYVVHRYDFVAPGAQLGASIPAREPRGAFRAARPGRRLGRGRSAPRGHAVAVDLGTGAHVLPPAVSAGVSRQ
jgi:hypothetical protein